MANGNKKPCPYGPQNSESRANRQVQQEPGERIPYFEQCREAARLARESHAPRPHPSATPSSQVPLVPVPLVPVPSLSIPQLPPAAVALPITPSTLLETGSDDEGIIGQAVGGSVLLEEISSIDNGNTGRLMGGESSRLLDTPRKELDEPFSDYSRDAGELEDFAESQRPADDSMRLEESSVFDFENTSLTVAEPNGGLDGLCGRTDDDSIDTESNRSSDFSELESSDGSQTLVPNTREEVPDGCCGGVQERPRGTELGKPSDRPPMERDESESGYFSDPSGPSDSGGSDYRSEWSSNDTDTSSPSRCRHLEMERSRRGRYRIRRNGRTYRARRYDVAIHGATLEAFRGANRKGSRKARRLAST